LSIRFQADNDLKFGIVKAVRRREPGETRVARIPTKLVLGYHYGEHDGRFANRGGRREGVK
jgi:hypothetical protein